MGNTPTEPAPPKGRAPRTYMPEPLANLRRRGWSAPEVAAEDLSAGRITYERALAATLDQVHQDWEALWRELHRRAPVFANELARELAQGWNFMGAPPLRPLADALAVSGLEQ